MAQTVHPTHFRDTHSVELLDFDPDSADAVNVAWRDMREYGRFVAGFMRTIGTGALDMFTIVAASNNTGANLTTILSKTISSQPDAVGDYVFLEITADQIAHEDTSGVGLRYVSARLEFATSTDEGVVLYIRGDAQRARANLTADAIA